MSYWQHRAYDQVNIYKLCLPHESDCLCYVTGVGKKSVRQPEPLALVGKLEASSEPQGMCQTIRIMYMTKFIQAIYTILILLLCYFTGVGEKSVRQPESQTLVGKLVASSEPRSMCLTIFVSYYLHHVDYQVNTSFVYHINLIVYVM